MPFRDPEWWRLFAAPAAGGFITALLTAFLAYASPRPYPPDHLQRGLVEAMAAGIVGFLLAVHLGPLVAQLVHLTSPEGMDGVKILVAVAGWRLLPVALDLGVKILPGLARYLPVPPAKSGDGQ